ncbi:MAG: iron-containing redox enzyme family protein [Fuerstiella sp.]
MSITTCSDRKPQFPEKDLTLVETMDQRLAVVAAELEQQDYWKIFSGRTTSSQLVFRMMQQLMLNIWKYQQCVNESVFTAVGRHGRYVDEQPLIRAMLAVQIEEVGHGTVALDDYVKLGGSREHAMHCLPSPASLVVMATVRYLGERADPLCHLGYMYFFERFTTIVTEKALPILARHQYPEDQLAFVKLHAEEDIRHSDMLANVVAECEDRYPSARESILFGFDCFRQVYPHPVWKAVCLDAQEKEHGTSGRVQ